MGIKDIFASFRSEHDEQSGITWRIDPDEGVDFVIDNDYLKDPQQKAIEKPIFGMQYAYLKGYHEQGFAHKNAKGFTIFSEQVTQLDDDFFDAFDLPDQYHGSFNTRIEGNTGKSSFSVEIDLELEDGTQLSHYKIEGPFLKLAEDEFYRLNEPQWRMFQALDHHKSLTRDQKGEYENNWLAFQFQIAKKSGVNINLKHFEKLELVQPESIGVALDQLENGDVLLSPTYGKGLDFEDVQRRLGQINESDDKAILRVKDTFVLLDDARLEATKEILTNRRIPKEQVATFLKSPTAYLNAALIDLDTGFSLRVHGAELFKHKYFGDVEETGIDWFSAQAKMIEKPEQMLNVVDSESLFEELKSKVFDAKAHGASVIELEDHDFDVSDDERVQSTFQEINKKLSNIHDSASVEEQFEHEDGKSTPISAVVAIDSNDETEDFVKNSALVGFNPENQKFDRTNLKRTPFPHQTEGIHWLLEHFEQAFKGAEESGALLADDMGLGKTFMTLVSIAELYIRCSANNKPLKPVMIVAPLSLLENWQSEVEETFHESPFSDIIVLQGKADLKRFKLSGSKRETEQNFDGNEFIQDQEQIRYSLKIGNGYGIDRLDTSARLVLTTYQTLRDYQFSLSRVDWGVVAFDEAQNLKNPNTMATRAAKGLKSDFKLLATGTPVENSLKDIWCLMDTAVPGLLGSWQSFRTQYIEPITAANPEDVRETKIEVGRNLRNTLGHFMLRRTKEERLEGLPTKTIFTGDANNTQAEYLPSLAAVMKGVQLNHYDHIIDSIRVSKVEDKRKLILPGLLRMKITSIHHEIELRNPIPKKTKDFIQQAEMSSKFVSLLSLLKLIKQRDEKVIIFATPKLVQVYVAALVTSLFKTSVEIINGDTQAVATPNDTETRKSIIDKFQNGLGFGVIVMSPIAAGVGLTVTGANNVIHFERHWNPAKEAQATDRVYRIGQTKNVNVYIPMALHPSMASFDLQLNSLLGNKIDLSDAVVSNSQVEADDLMGCFG